MVNDIRLSVEYIGPLLIPASRMLAKPTIGGLSITGCFWSEAFLITWQTTRQYQAVILIQDTLYEMRVACSGLLSHIDNDPEHGRRLLSKVAPARSNTDAGFRGITRAWSSGEM